MIRVSKQLETSETHYNRINVLTLVALVNQ